MPQVSSKTLLVILSVALALALMAVAYLLGQRSVVPVSIGSAVAPAREAYEAPPTHAPLEHADVEGDGEVVIERKNGQVSIVTPSANEGDKKTWAMNEYFGKVHALQVGPPGTSPQSFAQQMLSDTMNGDTSGIDGLLKEAKDAERKAKDLRPPTGAEGYHRKLIDLLGDSARLLASEREALITKNSDQLMSLVSTAKRLEQKALALEEEEKSLNK